MRLNHEKLRTLAYKKGVTQTALASASGVSRIAINGIFNGKSCKEETARKIAEALEVSLGEIKQEPIRVSKNKPGKMAKAK